ELNQEKDQTGVERGLDIPDDAVIRARKRVHGRNKRRIDGWKRCRRMAGGDGIPFPREKVNRKAMVVQLVPFGSPGKPVDGSQPQQNSHEEQNNERPAMSIVAHTVSRSVMIPHVVVRW